jgi:hypothetical protein
LTADTAANDGIAARGRTIPSLTAPAGSAARSEPSPSVPAVDVRR